MTGPGKAESEFKLSLDSWHQRTPQEIEDPPASAPVPAPTTGLLLLRAGGDLHCMHSHTRPQTTGYCACSPALGARRWDIRHCAIGQG